MVNSEKYQKQLDHLRGEHDALEDKIAEIMRNKVIHQFTIQDLKRKKLIVRESITQLEDMLLDNNAA